MRETALVVLLAAACGDDGSAGGGDGGGDGGGADGAVLCDEAAKLAWCDGDVEFLWDPGGGFMYSVPDDALTSPDETTVTGRRIDLANLLTDLSSIPKSFQPVILSLDELDGWGTLAGGFLRFSAAVDPKSFAALHLVVLGGEGAPREVPIETRVTDEGATIIFEPMVPLPPATRAAMVATGVLRDPSGGCVAPGAALRDALGAAVCGTDAPNVEEIADALAALAQLGLAKSPADVSALLVFTTQSIVEESVAVAEDVAGRSFALDSDPLCMDGPLYRTCEMSFGAGDYRDDNRAVAGSTPTTAYSIPLTVYLPLAPGEFGGPPYPTVIFGHGLGGDRTQASRLADFAAPLGLATVAIDAVRHGQHPAGAEDSQLFQVADFFGIDIVAVTFDPIVMRDNWRQSTYDKLQLVGLLTDGGDLDADGDGGPDLDGDRLVYLGVSLGGIMGPEICALAPEISAAVLVVPGARVSGIIRDSSTFAPLIDIFQNATMASDGDVERFFPILQTIIERGDAGNYAPYAFRARLPVADSATPSVLMGMVIDDAIVPNQTNRMLARALDTPHVPPVLQDVGVIEVTGATPIAGNIDDGVTAGLFQFDRVMEDGKVVPAEHCNIGDTEPGPTMWMNFLRTHLMDGEAEIIDPYEELGF